MCDRKCIQEESTYTKHVGDVGDARAGRRCTLSGGCRGIGHDQTHGGRFGSSPAQVLDVEWAAVHIENVLTGLIAEDWHALRHVEQQYQRLYITHMKSWGQATQANLHQ